MRGWERPLSGGSNGLEKEEDGRDVDVVVVVSGLLGLLVGALAPDVAAWACRDPRSTRNPVAATHGLIQARALVARPPTAWTARPVPGGDRDRAVFAWLAARLGPGPDLRAFLILPRSACPARSRTSGNAPPRPAHRVLLRRRSRTAHTRNRDRAR